MATNAIDGINTKETKFIEKELLMQTWLPASEKYCT
jgi:hypothetical protein